MSKQLYSDSTDPTSKSWVCEAQFWDGCSMSWKKLHTTTVEAKRLKKQAEDIVRKDTGPNVLLEWLRRVADGMVGFQDD